MHFKLPCSKWVWESYRKVETLVHLRQGWAGLEIYLLYNNNFLEQFEMFGRKRRFFDANMREICFPANTAFDNPHLWKLKFCGISSQNILISVEMPSWLSRRGANVSTLSLSTSDIRPHHRHSRREITLVGRTPQHLLFIDIPNAYINITYLHGYG